MAWKQTLWKTGESFFAVITSFAVNKENWTVGDDIDLFLLATDKETKSTQSGHLILIKKL